MKNKNEKTKMYLLSAYHRSFPVHYAFETWKTSAISVRGLGHHWDDLQPNDAESRYRFRRKA